MDIECDAGKAIANLSKHGIDFDEAATCLLDPMALVREDRDAPGEQRFVLVDMSRERRLLTVCCALRGEDTVRLISARKATRRERQTYAQGI